MLIGASLVLTSWGVPATTGGVGGAGAPPVAFVLNMSKPVQVGSNVAINLTMVGWFGPMNFTLAWAQFSVKTESSNHSYRYDQATVNVTNGSMAVIATFDTALSHWYGSNNTGLFPSLGGWVDGADLPFETTYEYHIVFPAGLTPAEIAVGFEQSWGPNYICEVKYTFSSDASDLPLES